ncbi:MAG: hypothetical protein E6713_06000 [Sporomusaceae bacterium]|nr:hypothetical protein [Sporomusaceae bacterium]
MPKGTQFASDLAQECTMVDFRNGAGLTLEKAAAAANYERRTVARYEKTPEKANPLAILTLAKAYHSDEMLEWYCTEVCDIGKEKHCKMRANDLAAAGLRWLKELQDVINVKDRLIAILCDGRVDASELNDLEMIMREIDELEGAVHGLRIKVSREVDKLAKEKPPVLEHRRLLG